MGFDRSDGKLMNFFRPRTFAIFLTVMNIQLCIKEVLFSQLPFLCLRSHLWTHFTLIFSSASICQARRHFGGVYWLWHDQKSWWLSVQVSGRVAVRHCSQGSRRTVYRSHLPSLKTMMIKPSIVQQMTYKRNRTRENKFSALHCEPSG